MKKLATITMKGQSIQVEMNVTKGQDVADKEMLVAQAVGTAIMTGYITVELTDLHENVIKLNGDSK